MAKKEEFSKDNIKRRTSRKSYLFYYLMALIVLGSIAYIYFNKELTLNTPVAILAIIFVAGIIKYTEVHRLMSSYTLTHTALEFTEGLIVKNVQMMKYGSISDAGILQSPWQRFLNIGDLMVSQFSENLEIKNINKPKEILEEITRRI